MLLHISVATRRKRLPTIRKRDCINPILSLPAIVCLFVRFNQDIHGDRVSRPYRCISFVPSHPAPNRF